MHTHPVDAWLAVTLISEHAAVGRGGWQVVIGVTVPLAVTVGSWAACFLAALLLCLVVLTSPGGGEGWCAKQQQQRGQQQQRMCVG